MPNFVKNHDASKWITFIPHLSSDLFFLIIVKTFKEQIPVTPPDTGLHHVIYLSTKRWSSSVDHRLNCECVTCSSCRQSSRRHGLCHTCLSPGSLWRIQCWETPPSSFCKTERERPYICLKHELKTYTHMWSYQFIVSGCTLRLFYYQNKSLKLDWYQSLTAQYNFKVC